MTNWMTAAGIALIAGGLATMIGFRRALWSGNGRRRAGDARALESRTPHAQRAIEASQRRAELSVQAAPVPPARVEPGKVRVRPAAMLPAQAGAPDISGAHAAADIRAAATPGSPATHEPVAEAPAHSGSFTATPDDVVAAVPGSRGGRRGRPRSGRQSAERPAADHPSTGVRAARQAARVQRDEEERFGLAAIGLAGDDVDGDIAEPPTAEPDELAARRAEATGTEPAADEPAEVVDSGVPAAGEESSVDIEPHAGAQLAVEVLHAELEAAAAQTGDEPPHRRVASRVLARADEGTREGARFDLSAGRLIRPHDDEAAGASSDVESLDNVPPPVRRPDRGRGDRVDGWIRPQYTGEPDSPAGDYWTPVPDGTYAGLDGSDYGWPVPIDRLPAVPSYPPASGFDLEPIEEAEPTAVVPQWPPAKPSSRIELPRAWSATNGPVNIRPLDPASARRWAEADDDGRDGWRRNHGPEDGDRWPAENGPGDDRWAEADPPADEGWTVGAPDGDDGQEQTADPVTGPNEREGRAMWPADEPDQRPRRRSLMIRRGNRPDADPPSRGRQAREARRRVTSATEHLPAVADSTQMLPQVSPGPERDGEPRRRPRPRPGPQSDARSTVYVSKHAAEPS